MSAEKLEANIPAMRISKEQHSALVKLAKKNFRNIQDQARYCLSIGMQVEEAGGISSYVQRLVKQEVERLLGEREQKKSKSA